MSETEKNRIIKLYIKIGPSGSGGDNYKSFLLSPSETFESLKIRAFDKLGIRKVDGPFYYITLQFQNTSLRHLTREPYIPRMEEFVLSVLEREEIYHHGELALSLMCRRREMQKNAASDHSLANPDLCSEFISSPLLSPKSLNESVLEELENIALKLGALHLQQI
jgi:hypothetical protein